MASSRRNVTTSAGSEDDEADSEVIALRVVFPKSDIQPVTYDFHRSKTIRAVLRHIIEDKGVNPTPADHYGLIRQADEKAGGKWLDETQTLRDVGIRSEEVLTFKNQNRPVKVRDLDNTLIKTIPIPDGALVRKVLSVIAHRFGVQYPLEYALQIATGPSFMWLDESQTLATQHAENSTLIFRKKYFINDQYITVKDSVSLHFMYIEARHAVLNGTYAVSLEDALELAALQLQIVYQNNDPLVHVAGFLELHEVLPSKFRAIPYIEEDLYERHRKLKDTPEVDLKFRYLQRCMTFSTYGTTIFTALELNADNNGADRDVLVGVRCDALVVFHPETRAELHKTSLFLVKNFHVDPQRLRVGWQAANIVRHFMFASGGDAIAFEEYVHAYMRLNDANHDAPSPTNSDRSTRLRNLSVSPKVKLANTPSTNVDTDPLSI